MATHIPNNETPTPFDGLEKLKTILDLDKKGIIDAEGLGNDRDERIRRDRVISDNYKTADNKYRR